MNRSLSLIGMGEDGFDGLSASARTLIADADVIVGSGRLLGLLPPLSAALYNWPSPFDPMVDRIRDWVDKRVVILATGDPMNYGVGALLAPRLKHDLKIIPAPSAFSLAAARMGWSLPDVEMISLHGRNISLIEPVIAPGVKILALTEGDETVRAVAQHLVERDYGESAITVLEHMGGPLERCASCKASEMPQQRFADLSTIAVECTAGPGAVLLSRVPGLPDDLYVHDGQLTKREVRAITLSALSPVANALLWDVGAGCGSISIEWIRAVRGARAIAFESDEQRSRMISENARRLGAPDMTIITGKAPEALADQPTPDAVFLGGAVSNDAVFDAAWRALRSGGRIVANAVTLEGEAALCRRHRAHGGELLRIDTAHVVALGTKRALRPRMAVLQWQALKP
jgi:precorrin-6B C5,15-methyltransferase / cobalt-precorrin-6B C5,C15-methyltransferase